MCPEKQEEEKLTADDLLLKELEAAHQARINKQMLEQLKKRQVDVQTVLVEKESDNEEMMMHKTENNAYAALLEQRRHIYSSGSGCSSWGKYDDCVTWQDCSCHDNYVSYPYALQDQINRIENMVCEIYATNQKLYNCIVEYYQKFIYCKPSCQ